MGTWGTAIKDNDAFADIYSEFFDLYNKGGQPHDISLKIITDNWEMFEIEEEKHSFWFALALAQWETRSLEPEVFATIENIISSGANLKVWLELGSTKEDIKKREVALHRFLEKLKSDRPKVKLRKKEKLIKAIFSKGDCLTFKLRNGNYGGAVVLEEDTNPETAYNLIATTRLNKSSKPTLSDFQTAEVLICNFGEWNDRPDIAWYMPDLFHKHYTDIYEMIGKLLVETQFDSRNHFGKKSLFKPSYTSGWYMNDNIDRQLDSEITRQKPSKTLTIKQLIKKKQWWKIL
jgi:hypothetical protein